MHKIGLTGGIGAGKSVAAKIFAVLGIPIFNADIEAARLMHHSEEIRKELISLFGNNIYNEFGLNRDMLRKKIFNDAGARTKVNQVVHPHVYVGFNAFCETHQHAPYVIQESALLLQGNNYKTSTDKVIVVTAPNEVRLDRVRERDGLETSMVQKIIDAQMPQDEMVKKAWRVLVNDGKHFMLKQVLHIHKLLI